jgi:GNAT superfamily N-acetyltransferase
MIDDQQASILIEAFPQADPAMQDQIRPQIQEWHDATQKRLDAERSAREAQIRPLFSDVETLGGKWSKEMQAELGPFVPDANKARAQSANMAFLAHATEIPLDRVAPVYDTLRDQYANENFNGPKDDLGFYTAIQGKFQQRDDRAAFEAKRKGDATSAAFLQAIDAGAPVYDSAYTDWQAKANTAKGYDPAQEGADFAQYRDTYQKAYEVARENRDIFAAVKSTLERSTKAINAGADLPFEAATRLMEAEPEKRKAVLQMLTAYAAHNQPENPQGAVQQVGAFFKNMGVSYLRGIDPLRVTNTSRMFTLLDARKEIDALESGKEFMVNPDRPLGPKIAPGEIESADGSYTGSPWRPATPEERAQRLANAKKADALIRLSMELDRVAKNELDPVKPVATYLPDVVERGFFGLAGSVPQMMAAAVPGVGMAWMTNSMVNQEFERLTLDHPEINPEKGYAMALVSGGIQAVLERFQLKSTLGQLPFTKGLVDLVTDPTSSFWRSFAIKGAANVFEQNLQEGLQDITPAVVQQTASALSKDIPGVDWKKELGDWTGSRAETFFAVLPLALLGTGVGSLKESRAVAQALTSPQTMVEAGILLEDAQRIATISNLSEKEAAFRQAWRDRTEESKAAGKKAADARVAAEQAIANNPQAPHLEPVGNEIHMIEPDGTVSAKFTSEEAAAVAYQDRLAWEANGNAQAVRDLVAWYAAKDSSGKWEVLPNKQTLDMESQASPESVAEQMKLAGYAAGTSPADVRVYGSNTGEVREGLYEDVSRLFLGSTPADVVHERTHSQFKRELASGAISMDAAEKAARVYLGEKAPATMSPEQIHEAVAEMGVDYFIGNLRKIDNLPASVRGFFARIGVFFKAAFQRAAALKKLFREGKLDADWEAFLARAVGVDSVVEQNRATVRAAGELAEVSFSLKPADNSFSNALSDFQQELRKSGLSVTITSRGNDITLSKIIVPEEARGQGAGTNAIQRLQEFARANGKRILLTPSTDFGATSQTRLERFYSKLGFEKNAGRSRDFSTQESMIWTPPGLDTSFSLRPADYAERLAAQMDALKRNPTARVTIYENAKKKLSALVAQIRAEASAEPKDTRPNAEQIQAAKDTHAATLERLATEEAAAMQAASTKQAQNGVRLGFASKRAAADRALAAALAQTTGQTKIRTRQIQSLAEYNAILSAFPAEVRGKVGGFVQLAEIKTDRGRASFFADRIDRLERELEKTLKKEYLGTLSRIFENARPKGSVGEKAKGTMGAFVQGWFSEAERISQLSELQLQAEEALVESKISGASPIEPVDITDLNRKFDGINTEDKALAGFELWNMLLQSFGAINGRTSAEIASAVELAKATMLKGKLDWKTQVLDRATQWERFRESLIQESGGYGGDDLIARRKIENEKLGAKTREILDSGNDWQQTISQITGQNSATHAWAEKIVRDSINAERSAMAERGQGLQDALRKIIPGGVLARLRRLDELARPREIKTASGSSLLLSELQAVHYTMLWSDPDSKEWLTENGYGADAQAAFEGMFSPEARQIRSFLEAQYEAQYDKINAVYKRMFGVNMPRVGYYAPRYVDHGGNVKDMALTAEGASGTLQSGFTKRRVTKPGKPPLRIDALSAYTQNAMQVEHWVNWAETMRTLRGVFMQSDSMRAIKANHGEKMAGNVSEFLKMFDRGGVENARGQEMLRRWMQSTTDNALLLKLATLAKQLPAAYSSASVIGFNKFMGSASRVLSGRGAISLHDMIQSPIIQRRINSMPIEWKQAMQGDRGVLTGLSRAAQKLGADPRAVDVFLNGARESLGVADAVFTGVSAAIVYDAAYREAVAMNLTPEAARAHALEQTDQVVQATAQPETIDRKSLFEARLGITGKLAFALFQGANRQAFAMTRLAVQQGRWGDAGRNVGVYWVLNGLVLQTIGNLMRYATSDDDWEEDWRPEDYAKAIAMGPLTGALWFGPMIEAVFARLPGGYEPRQASPALDAYKLLKNMSKDEFDIRDAGAVTQGLSVLLGGRFAAIGLGWNVTKQVLGFKDAVTEGDQETVSRARK